MTEPAPPTSSPATLYRARALDAPHGRVGQAQLRADGDLGLLVRDGVILARGPFPTMRRHQGSDADVVDLRDGVLLPGFVDTHVHYPQVRIIGGLGRPLLQWLDERALPEEARLADVSYARGVAAEFLASLAGAGTTTALVFGSHFAGAVDALFEQAEPTGLRITAGLVVGDRMLRDDLHTEPARAVAEGSTLAGRWHGAGGGRLRYAVTPRFSLSASEALLDSCAHLLDVIPGAFMTSHLNENLREVATVAELFTGSAHYLDTYARHGLVTARTVLAHNVHATAPELALLASAGASVAHCPTSNAALGSGLFPLAQHVQAGVAVALGSDVGGGTGYSLLKEGLQAYFMQQLLGEQGLPLRPADLLHLATTAGARALGIDVGSFDVGHAFDAVLVQPPAGAALDIALRHADGDEDALAKIFALGTSADLASVWVGGQPPRVASPDALRAVADHPGRSA